jgi:general stress protein 26
MHATPAEAMEKLTELVKDIEIAMLTTVEADGSLHSRPMGTQEMKDGNLWFFVKDDSRKAKEVERDPRVNVSYVDSNTWVSVSGRATITRDRAKIDELWKESLKAWFPQGKAEPHLALMKVEMDEGEYWDVTSSSMVQLFSYVKSRLMGETAEAELAEHQVVRR